MPVKRRKPKVKIQGFPDWQIRFMETGEVPPDNPDINEYTVIEWQYHRATPKHDPVRDAWLKVGEKILSSWIERHPGTRPFCWWAFQSKDPRQRLGGTGTPAHEKLAFKPSFRFGIPDNWVYEHYCRWYPDKNLRVPDPLDPPTFESQAAYLDRHKLLSDAERESLPGDAFEPVPYVEV